MTRNRLKTFLLGVAALIATGSVAAAPMNFSFTGTFAQDDDVQLFSFTADGASAVTLRSYSYAGGTQADGNVVPRGGFDPILALFDSTGALVAQQDDDPNDNGVCDGNFDPNTGTCWDTFFTQVLAAGSYTVAIMEYDNFAIGPNLSDGFVRDGQGNFTGAFGCSNGSFCDVSGAAPWDNRSNAWAFDILNVESAAAVPEPASLLLVSIAALGLAGARRRTGTKGR